MPVCPSCKRELDAEQFLAASTELVPHNRLVEFRCPECGGRSVARIESGRIATGYIYGAGASHFSVEDVEDVPGLTVSITDDQLSVRVDGKEIRLAPAPPPKLLG